MINGVSHLIMPLQEYTGHNRNRKTGSGYRIRFYATGIGCLSSELVQSFRPEINAILLAWDAENQIVVITPVEMDKAPMGARALVPQKKTSVRTFSGRGFLNRFKIESPCSAELEKDKNGTYSGVVKGDEPGFF